MANVYAVGQEALANADLDLGATPGTVMKCRVITDAAAVVFDNDDATMTDVMANDGGTALTATAETDITLTGKVVTLLTDGVDLKADKVTYTAVGAGETWAAAIIYDEGGGTDGTRIPFCHVDFTADLPTSGVDMEVRWNAVDGVGAYAGSLNS